MKKHICGALLGCVIVASMLLAFAGDAVAKDEIKRLRVCGASACRTVTNVSTIRAISSAIGGNPGAARPRPARYYTLVSVPRWSTFVGYVYVPSRAVGMLKWHGEPASWYQLDWAEPILRRVVRGLTPFSNPRAWSGVRWRR